ncbi:hypothetical protein ACFFLZ_13990 [Photobacterium aphoticum]|uniref:Uncharacterized protein n=1 Tax=Photobacterium aphoticum TaxID=754436 RepID=A0A090QMK0_9GAMM|nr:hypothetical protein [Photobacterium aphoticum]GAL03458.1 hypothetical protein JCM19237_6352 [Photobacterium aphoticum]GHA42449.1 hypothetical protein GCM10007086_15060 [Photobacterium aphoticum]
MNNHSKKINQRRRPQFEQTQKRIVKAKDLSELIVRVQGVRKKEE